MAKCKECGNTFYIGGIEAEDGTIFCSPCGERIKQDKKEFKKINIELNDKETKIMKSYVKKTDLSIQELQLQELMKMKAEIVDMKGDLHTIKDIILFWFIIGLIGFLISIISILALTGNL